MEFCFVFFFFCFAILSFFKCFCIEWIVGVICPSCKSRFFNIFTLSTSSLVWTFPVPQEDTHTFTHAYFTCLYEFSSLIDEEIDSKLQCPSWWMTSFGPMCWSRMPKLRLTTPPSTLSLRSPWLTIDQWEFWTAARFEFNAWGRKAVDVALYCPSPSLIALPPLHSPSIFIWRGFKHWQIQRCSVCLPSYANNHSLLNGPSAFRWIIVCTCSITRGV